MTEQSQVVLSDVLVLKWAFAINILYYLINIFSQGLQYAAETC